MVEPISMRAYQLALSEQLKNATVAAPTTTMLGVALGEDRWLIHMNEVNEVLQMPRLMPVSLTQPWFLGMANVRGNLYGITDLRVYYGGMPAPLSLKMRILLVSPRFGINSGLLVSSMLGIRSLSDFELIADMGGEDRTGMAGYYRDKTGRIWCELSLQALMKDKKFLQVAV